MKIIYTLCLCIAISSMCIAQSAISTDYINKDIIQNIGPLEVKLHYTSMHTDDKKVFGNVVPFNQVWLDDNTSNTKITFDKTVVIGDQSLAAGTYAIFIIPAEGVWTFIFQDADKYASAGQYLKINDIFRMGIITKNVEEFKNSYSIVCTDIQPKSFKISHAWGNTVASLPVKFEL